MAGLGQQIAKLMATLTQNGHGSSTSSTPGSPWECGCKCGCSVGSTPSHSNSHNSGDGPGQMTPAQSLLSDVEVEGTGSQGGDQGNCRPSVRGRL